MPATTTLPAPPATPASPDTRALAAVVVTVVCWASAFVAIREVGRSFDPGALALGRLLIAAVVLGLVVAMRGGWVTPTRREWGLVFVCGLAWFAAYNIALNAAEQRIDAGTAAMLVNVGPILIGLFAGTVLGEGFPRWPMIGAAIAFVGALLIGVATAESAGADLAGVGLCLLAALGWAVGVTAQKPALQRLPALQVTLMACVIGAVACLPFAGTLAGDAGGASGGALAGLLYLGLVPTALAFGTWAYALSRMDAGRLGITTYLVPPLTIVAAWPLLDEVPPALAFAGGELALAGVFLSRRR